MNEAKPRFPRSIGIDVARELLLVLSPACERIVVAGSLRRLKETVGDVEILFIPKFAKDQPIPGEMFAVRDVDLAGEAIAELERAGVLERRKSITGGEAYGEKNKLMRHVASGCPVDLFTATEANWWNYLVCRTGSADSNMRIASAAKARGWKWEPYKAGFKNLETGQRVPMESEEAVFAFVGLPYLEPKDR